MLREIEIVWPKGVVTGKVEGGGPLGVLLAHGAGTDQDHPAMAALRAGLASGGLTVMSFNYPYTQRGAKRPDPQPTLVECHRAAAESLARDVERLFLAGRSMGGRIGTHIVAEGLPAHGLILYAYPLHPPGKPEKLRIAHLREIDVPMLFFQGTRDSLARMDLFNQHIASLPNSEVELLDGAGHGPRGGGWDVESMTQRYVDVSLDWIERVSSGTSRRAAP